MSKSHFHRRSHICRDNGRQYDAKHRGLASWLAAGLLFIAAVVSAPGRAAAGQDGTPAQPAGTISPTDAIPRVKLLRKIHDPEYPGTTPSAITWSPTGDKLAAETYGAVTVWDSNLSEIARLDRSGAGWDAKTLAFIDGSREIATSPASYKSDTVTTSIFDIATARVIHEIPGWLLTPVPGTLRAHNRTAALAVSPDQSILAVATGTPWDRRPIRFYSTKTWELSWELPLAALGLDDRDDGVTRLAFAAKAPRLAVVAGWASTVLTVYDTERRSVILTLGQYPNQSGPINAVAITAEGDYVAVAVTPGNTRWFHPDGSLAPPGQGEIRFTRLPEYVRVYRVADGALVGSLTNPTGQFDIKWRPGSRVLAFVALDAIYFWSPFQSSEAGPRIPLGRGAVSLEFSPDGTKLAAGGDANLFVFSLENPQ